MCTHPFKVMIVDDNDAEADTLARGLLSLEPPPYVIAFRTASEALEALHTRSELASATEPFLILVEADLPLVSGFEFVACLRCDTSLSRIPVFVLTAASATCEQLVAHDLGVTGYLRKPTTPGESSAIAAQLKSYVRSMNSPAKLRQAGFGRTRVARPPHRVAGSSKMPAAQRRSISNSVG